MSFNLDNICCLANKAQSCVAKIGYEISLKENSGYNVDSLYVKLNFVLSIKKIIDNAVSKPKKTYKKNIINFCGQKVFMSRNNSLFLTNIDSHSCLEESELAEECCIDLCDVESKLNEICRHC